MEILLQILFDYFFII